MRKLAIATALALGAAVAYCAWGVTPVKLWEKNFRYKKVGAVSFPPKDGATAADVDRDGLDEVLFASTDGKCYCWRCDGSDYAGFPTQVHRTDIFFHGTPAVGDIDGDGDREVVVGARGYARDGALYAWHHDGTPVNGFPLDGMYIYGTVALEDMNGDGVYDIVAPERANNKVHVFDGKGAELPGWPVPLPEIPLGDVAVGDVDGDKKPEVLLSGFNSSRLATLFAWNADGTPAAGFPVVLTENPNIYGSYAAPTLADFDHDGALEIALGLTSRLVSYSLFFILEGNGRIAPGWPKEASLFYATAAAADVDGDRSLEVVAIGKEQSDSRLNVWNYDGSSAPGFPVVAMSNDDPIVADIDGDGRVEIMASMINAIVAYNHDGSPVEGFSIVFNKYLTAGNCPTTWDIDRDGKLELAVCWWDQSTDEAGLVVYRLGGDAASPVWAMHKHGPRHTACYDVDLGVGITLDYFCARAEGKAILLRWATAGEWNHAGFNLYRARAEGDGARARVNASLITGKSPYRFLDRGVESAGEYKYWLEAVDLNGGRETYGPVHCAGGGAGKASFALAQNSPNPARGVTTIAFSVPAPGDAAVGVYDIAGRKVASRVVAAKAGGNDVELDVSSLAPGVYTYRLEAGGKAAARRMVVVR